MKFKIKHIFFVLIAVFTQLTPKAQAKIEADSNKTKDEKKVNVLYGTQQYDRFVGNMSSVKGERLKTYPSMMVMEALAGRLPGVFIRQSNGNPGEDNFNTAIRGSVGGYITLVDGIERPLNPYDIEQIDEISVLKDPVSKALYGGRTSNGIIMVTTKRGKTMNSEFHVGVQKGVKMPTSLPKYLNSFDFATNYNKALANDNNGVVPAGQGYSQADLDAYQNGTNPLKYPDVDYYGQFLNKAMQLTRVSTEYYGGNESTRFYVHGGYQKEGGFEAYGSNPRQMNAFNLQGSIDSKFSNEIILHSNFAGYMADKRYPGTFSMGTLSTRYPNAYPIFVAHDSVGGTASYKDNPYAQQAQSGYIKENHVRMQADLGFDIKLDKVIKGLTIKPVYSFDIYHKQNLQKLHTVGIYKIDSFDVNNNPAKISTLQTNVMATSQGLGDDDYGRRWGFTNTVNYKHDFGKSSVDADLVYFISKMVYGGELYDYKRQNLGLRMNYNYDGKYTLEGVLNYTGSQSFAADKRFQYFPAVGAGWIISKENFMKKASFIDYLKLNGSWGIMGDGNIAPYLYRQTWAGNGSYAFNTSTTGAATILNQVASTQLNWPKQSEVDISLEAKMFKNIGWKVSYFSYMQSDLLSKQSNIIPLINGGTDFLPQTNFGKTGLRGMEAELSYTGTAGKLSYAVSTHLTYSKSNKTVIDELPDPLFSTQGTPWDVTWGYSAIGTYTQADIDNVIAGTMAKPSYMDPKALRVGNIIYQDLNNDKIIDRYDTHPIGNNAPRLMYGGDFTVSYKGFGLYAMLLGFGEYKQYLGNSFYQVNSTRKYSSVLVTGLPNGNPHPPLTTGSAPNDFQPSDYWIVNGGFLKLKNVSLSYTLPERMTKAIRMSNMKLFLYGTNLLTFSKIKDSDPEAMDAGLTAYPLFRTYAAGISITF